MSDPITDHAVALIRCATPAQAAAYAARLRGHTLAEVADRLGVTGPAGSADRTRKAVVAAAIGDALDTAAIQHYDRPKAATAHVNAYRRRRIREITATGK